MKIRNVDHFNKETGAFNGSEIQMKPYWWWPVWMKVNSGKIYSSEQNMRNDVFFLLALNGELYHSSKYD